jgi:hypothetical protein
VPSSDAKANMQFHTTGYGVLKDSGHDYQFVAAIGNVVGLAQRDRVELVQVQSQQILKGMSGAPVIVDEVGGVVGILSGRYSIDPRTETWLRDTGWVTGIENLANLDERVKARLMAQSEGNIGKLMGAVPPLHSHYLPRATELSALRDKVLCQEVSRVGIAGMGGLGKSVLAASLAKDRSVRQAFRDGVIWVPIGKQPAITSRQWDIAQALGRAPSTPFQDSIAGTAHLSTVLADKTCLIILDDVWDMNHVSAFGALGPRCKMVLTTRISEIVTSLGAELYQLDLLSNEQARTLLASWASQNEESLPAEANEVVRECGRLPLALAMVGAMVGGNPLRWNNVLYRLQNADLERIRRQLPNYPYPDLLKAIQVSMEELNPEVRSHYLQFAVFPEGTPIPEAALKTFWGFQGAEEHDIEDYIDLLVSRSLLRKDLAGDLTIHDLQHDYVQAQVDNVKSFHTLLLDAYVAQSAGGWTSGPNDGYFFQHLGYHLLEADRAEELCRLLTGSPDWMEKKFITLGGHTSYAADLDLALETLEERLSPERVLLLAQLETARQVVRQWVRRYTDVDLRTLVLLGQDSEAFSHASLRSDSGEKVRGLLVIGKAQQEVGRSEERSL